MLFQIETANLIPGNLARSRLGIYSGAEDRHASEENFIDYAPIGAGDAPGAQIENHHELVSIFAAGLHAPP